MRVEERPTPSEGRARELVAYYSSLLWEHGLVCGTSGNVSVRLADGRLVVTPSGASLRSLSADELVLVPADGTAPVGKNPSSELPLHVSAYRVRPDIGAVVHTHPTYCVVWAQLGRLFPAEHVAGKESLRPIAWNSYADPGSHELAELAAASFQNNFNCVLMERHGLTAIAATLEEAYLQTELAEQCAKIALLTESAERWQSG